MAESTLSGLRKRLTQHMKLHQTNAAVVLVSLRCSWLSYKHVSSQLRLSHFLSSVFCSFMQVSPDVYSLNSNVSVSLSGRELKVGQSVHGTKFESCLMLFPNTDSLPTKQQFRC